MRLRRDVATRLLVLTAALLISLVAALRLSVPLRFQATLATTQAAINRANGSLDAARARYDEAADIYAKLGSWDDEADSISAAITTSPQGSNLTLAYLRRLLALNFSSDNEPRLAGTLDQLGDIYFQRGHPEEAVRFYLETLQLTSITPGPDLASVRAKLANSYRSVGDDQTAAKYDRGSSGVSALQKVGGALTPTPAASDNAAGETGTIDLRPLIQKADKAHADGNPQLEIASLKEIGVLAEEHGAYDVAQRVMYAALEVARSGGDKAAEADLLGTLARSYENSGDTSNAYKLAGEALDLVRQSGDRKLEENILWEIAGLYDGDAWNHGPQNALNYAEDSWRIHQSLPNDGDESKMLAQLGTYAARAGDTAKAKVYLTRALGLAREDGDKPVEASVLFRQAELARQNHDYPTALGQLTASLDIRQALGDRREVAVNLHTIGDILQDAGDSDAALERYHQSLVLDDELGDRAGAAVTRENIGTLYEANGDLEQALDAFRLVVAEAEVDRRANASDTARTQRFQLQWGLFDRLIRYSLRLGNPVEAFNRAEEFSARTLLDQLSRPRVELNSTTPTSIIKQTTTVRNQLRDLDRSIRSKADSRRSPSDDQQLRDLESQLVSKQAEYADLRALEGPLNTQAEPGARMSEPLKLTEVQASLDNDTTLVVYTGTQENIVAFVISARTFNAVELSTKGSDLDSVVDLHQFAVPDAVPLPQLTDLNRRLIEPVRPYLHTRNLGIVAPDFISFVPFASLTSGDGRYLDEDFAIFYLPSASVLPVLQARVRTRKDVLSLAESSAPGFPTLPHADEEAQKVASLYGDRALIGSQASETSFKNLAGSFGVLHVAAHTEIDATDGAIARIVLSPTEADDGFLQAFEVDDLDLGSTDLVVLSACQTLAALPHAAGSSSGVHIGPYHAGEGFENLTRAFLRAGAKSVVGSLREVDDASTEVLMTAFHRYVTQGINKAESLQRAQADTRALYPSPYYWAGFELTGDPGPLGGTR